MKRFAQEVRSKVGIDLSVEQISAFEAYERILMEWNQGVNLTAIETSPEIRVKHFLDSLTCLQVMRGTAIDRVVDVGAGGGFPGLGLKIAVPEMGLTLVESVRKKAEFCQYVAKYLGLTGVEVLNARVEMVGQMESHRELYDWAVARAVAGMATLAEYLLPLVQVGGRMLAQKGENAPDELKSAEKAIEILGGRFAALTPVSLPGVPEERYLVVVDKVSVTPDKYPRRVGVPTKRPL